MKISAVNSSVNFGKIAYRKCQVIDKNSQTKVNATIYKMEPQNDSDVRDVIYSKLPSVELKYSFKNSFNNSGYYDFLLMQNNKTNEVISCAKISHHYGNVGNNQQGFYTLVEEMQNNPKYENGMQKMMEYISDIAYQRGDKNIITDEN